MAGLLCSAIVGFLCVQVPIGDTLNVKLEDQGIYVADAIQAKDWTLSWSRSMERMPPVLDRQKLAKACDGAICVLYWRKCTDAAHSTTCSYAVGLEGNSNVYFDVTATDAAGMTQATDAFRIVVDFKSGTSLPLAKLDRDGPGDQAPILPAPPNN